MLNSAIGFRDDWDSGEYAFSDDLCRNAGRGCAKVRNKIAYREVNLVTHSRHDRQGLIEDCASHNFLVEGPKIFQAAAAPCNENQIQPGRGRTRLAGSAEGVEFIQQPD